MLLFLCEQKSCRLQMNSLLRKLMKEKKVSESISRWWHSLPVFLLGCPAVALVFCGGCSPAPVAPLDWGHQALRAEEDTALKYKDQIFSLPTHNRITVYTRSHPNGERRPESPTALGHRGNTVFDPSNYTPIPTHTETQSGRWNQTPYAVIPACLHVKLKMMTTDYN